MFEGNVVVGLEIGTTKVCTVIGEYDHNRQLRIAGVGVVPTNGTLRKGVIVNIEAVTKAITQSIEMAEHEAGRTVESVYVGLPGNSVEGLNSRGVVAVSGKGQEIVEKDVERVLDAARAIAIPMDREVVHVVPRQFIIDEQAGISDPVDMVGVRLEADVHIITGPVSVSQNIIKCVNRSGFVVDEIALESLASSTCALSDEEKELGVLLIDIGGGSSSWILFLDGAPYKSGAFPIGGNLVTHDLHTVLETGHFELAEQVKCEEGFCWDQNIDLNEEVIIPGAGLQQPRTVLKGLIGETAKARMEEIFKYVEVQADLKSLAHRLRGGVVLVGGGSRLRGADSLASNFFRMPGRIGFPMGFGELDSHFRDPLFASAFGLVQWGHLSSGGKKSDDIDSPVEEAKPVKAVLNWFKEFF